jgi:hypothetical protein
MLLVGLAVERFLEGKALTRNRIDPWRVAIGSRSEHRKWRIKIWSERAGRASFLESRHLSLPVTWKL